ncbi:MAG TPA: hypothetical protein VLR88_05570, partial [Propionibacteriaceae bacterium]|nr:hypothetical protein [Propionibacteriaceae bacterium]
RQEEIAEYLCGLGAEEIHVEPVYRVGRAVAGQPLDAAEFVRHFLAAREVARGHGVRYLTSGSDEGEAHGPHCHVLRQVLQLVPGDVATSCFAVADATTARREGLVIGAWDGEAFTIDDAAVRRQQERLAVLPTACQTCVARDHCAGACPEGCALTGRVPPDSFRCEVNRLLTEKPLESRGRQ